MLNVLLIGAGGQAKVIIDILRAKKNFNLVGVIDKKYSNINL